MRVPDGLVMTHATFPSLLFGTARVSTLKSVGESTKTPDFNNDLVTLRDICYLSPAQQFDVQKLLSSIYTQKKDGSC